MGGLEMVHCVQLPRPVLDPIWFMVRIVFFS